MKEVRMKNMITSGPQSHILEGVNWEEARQYAASQVDGTVPGNHVVMVGAASKGIIQRDFQHNATVYKSAYAKNPFDNVTEEELAEYRRFVEAKARGEIGNAKWSQSVSPHLLSLLFCTVNEDQIPENVKHLLAEPISLNQDSQDIASPTSPTSPLSDEEGNVSRLFPMASVNIFEFCFVLFLTFSNYLFFMFYARLFVPYFSLFTQLYFHSH